MGHVRILKVAQFTLAKNDNFTVTCSIHVVKASFLANFPNHFTVETILVYIGTFYITINIIWQWKESKREQVLPNNFKLVVVAVMVYLHGRTNEFWKRLIRYGDERSCLRKKKHLFSSAALKPVSRKFFVSIYWQRRNVDILWAPLIYVSSNVVH